MLNGIDQYPEQAREENNATPFNKQLSVHPANGYSYTDTTREKKKKNVLAKEMENKCIKDGVLSTNCGHRTNKKSDT